MANSNPIEGAQELQEMLVTYAKQETVEPLKTLGRYLGFGVVGSLFVALGSFYLGLGLLRTLQTQTDGAFDGANLASTLPYLITIAVLLVVIAIIVALFVRAKNQVESPHETSVAT